MKILYVRWIDAVASCGWDSHENSSEVDYCEAIGFVVKETKLSICLAATISGTQSNSRITIPKAWIKEKVHVKL